MTLYTQDFMGPEMWHSRWPAGIPVLTTQHLHFTTCVAKRGLPVGPGPLLLMHTGFSSPGCSSPLSGAPPREWMSTHHPQAPALAVHP